MLPGVSKKQRIYLDNAATTWPKPTVVYEAMDDYARRVGAPAGRGAHWAGHEAMRIVDQCRQRLKTLLGAADADQVIFCFNGTDALNLCLHGLLKPGDHAIATDVEHNSVLRPLHWLKQHRGIEFDLIPCSQVGLVDPDQLRSRLRPRTRLVVVSHASNVTGAVQPVDELTKLAHEAGALVLIDAAQTAGCYPIQFRASSFDLLACSGHKGLLGPLGTGIVLMRGDLQSKLDSFRQGGTGSESESEHQPELAEAKYESGNLNMHGLAGLAAGLQFVLENGESFSSLKRELRRQLYEGLSSLAGVSLYGPEPKHACVDVLSFNVEGLDPHEVTLVLENLAQLQLRAGLHCAPRMHRTLGTASRGGAIRASLGPFSTHEHVSVLIDAVGQLIRER